MFNYKNIPVACQFCCGVNRQVKGPSLPSKTRKSRILHTSIQSVLILTFSQHLLWSWIYNCIPDACPIHSRYMTGNLWKIQLVWNWIPYGGWMLVYGRIPMKAELVEGVVVLCGWWTVSAEAGVTQSTQHKRSEIIEPVNQETSKYGNQKLILTVVPYL